jgi:hypothetical protein
MTFGTEQRNKAIDNCRLRIKYDKEFGGKNRIPFVPPCHRCVINLPYTWQEGQPITDKKPCEIKYGISLTEDSL